MAPIQRSNLWLTADKNRVIPLYLSLSFGSNRIQLIIDKIDKLTDEEVDTVLVSIINEFTHRHRNIKQVWYNHYNEVLTIMPEIESYSVNRRLLTGAYFTKEYSVESAAVFNPSMVEHPNQNGLQQGNKRFVMSLRSTGEGHISSISFQTGIVNKLGDIVIDKPSDFTTCSKKGIAKKYPKAFLKARLKYFNDVDDKLLDILPDGCTEKQMADIFNNYAQPYTNNTESTFKAVLQIADTNYDVSFADNIPINERVIFPNAKAESMGMEDVRFVKFTENGKVCYYGTYTAYNGHEIRSQLIETEDFTHFRIRTMYGNGVQDKGMALLPEKVNGKYVMISRQGGCLINIMYSNSLYFWDSWETIIEPQRFWESVQIGNCGSPIKTKKGWLLLTHAVGPMRRYVISAALLNYKNPSKVISTLNMPLIEPTPDEREGYVPNVVYSCGAMVNQNRLIIPYAMSDSASGFAGIDIDELLKLF